MSAPITPGIHPHKVRIKTINTDPQPLSMTARGGKIMERMTLSNDISIKLLKIWGKLGKRFRIGKNLNQIQKVGSEKKISC